MATTTKVVVLALAATGSVRAQPPGGGTSPSSGGTPCTSTCTNGNLAGCLAACASTCPNPPCGASLLGDVATTSVTGTDARSSNTFAMHENIYGPFEAGFSSQQDNILSALGCSDPLDGYVDGGIDTHTAEQMVAKACGVTLPRIENDGASGYISLIDECGGHTNEYHFHERMTCLYAQAGAHSTQVGFALDGRPLYGKWEDFSAQALPQLDSCGGHFGMTPDSNGEEIYHYHIQDAPPFTIGCFGPAAGGGLVTVDECRGAYPGDCGDGDSETIETPEGAIDYDLWCPCFDSTGSNMGEESVVTWKLVAFIAAVAVAVTFFVLMFVRVLGRARRDGVCGAADEGKAARAADVEAPPPRCHQEALPSSCMRQL